MNMELRRISHGHEAVDGQIWIGDQKVCDCVENARTAIPAGTYPVRLIKCHQYNRKMPLIMDGKPQSRAHCPLFCPGNGVHGRTDGRIIVGQSLVPGCLIHSQPAFDVLCERIRKNIARGNQINLIVYSA